MAKPTFIANQERKKQKAKRPALGWVFRFLWRSCEKVKDCSTTTRHVELFARALMKDAHRGLNR